MLPNHWKTSVVTFIPQLGKKINIENLRPISLAPCAGKLMEAAARQRLSNYLEQHELLPPCMFGFRSHLSAHDVVLQNDREVIDLPFGIPADRAIWALDLKGDFGNVKHSKLIQENSDAGNCGDKTFTHIKTF